MFSPYILPLSSTLSQSETFQVLIKHKLPSSSCFSITNHPRFSGRKTKHFSSQEISKPGASRVKSFIHGEGLIAYQNTQ